MTAGGTDGDLYSWDVRCGDERRAGPGGISADRQRALDALADALSAERAGSTGTVWAVRVRPGRRPGYFYEGLVAEGVHDPRSGAVILGGPPPPPSPRRTSARAARRSPPG